MKKWIALFLALCLCVSLAACGGTGKTDVPAAQTQTEPVAATEPTDWAIYWYLCGADLESQGGAATTDLNEMLAVTLPDNVQIVIETGGAASWNNDFVDASKLQRWLYAHGELTLVDEQSSASMGEAQTLADFLSFASTNYPGKKTAVTFWNHGGGNLSGAEFDELYDNDSLTLDEMYAAFSSVWEPSEQEPPLEMIGFDTCLMATVDTAYTFSDLAHYFVGSEELEPGCGWDYTGWLQALADDPSMDGAALGVKICDSFYAGCEAYGVADNTTLSVVDLTRLQPLMDAYDAFGSESLAAACQDPSFFTQFARIAQQSENYGGNTREQGYCNMVDLGDLARQSLGSLTSAQAVLDALDACVLYTVNGAYRSQASGLSCFYSYDADVDHFNSFNALGSSTAFKYLYSYGLTGELDEEGLAYASATAQQEITELPSVPSLADMGWDTMPLEVDEEGSAYMTLGQDAYDVLAGIGISLYLIDEETDVMLYLGTDNDLLADWDNGVFHDNFRGVWGGINGMLAYMELSYEGEDYNLYSVPVLLNGEEYNLQVAYDYTTEQWSILGARQGINDNGMTDKELRLLENGDVIDILWYASSASGNDDFEAYVADTITVDDDLYFSEVPLPDSQYAMFFEMWDAFGNFAMSDAVIFECADGEISTYA